MKTSLCTGSPDKTGFTRLKKIGRPTAPPATAKIVWKLTLTPDSSMSTAEPINEAQNLSSMADDVLRAVLARAVFDDQAALKRVCKRFLAVITSRSFREERRASGCLEHTVLVRTHRLRTRPPTRGR